MPAEGEPWLSSPLLINMLIFSQMLQFYERHIRIVKSEMDIEVTSARVDSAPPADNEETP